VHYALEKSKGIPLAMDFDVLCAGKKQRYTPWRFFEVLFACFSAAIRRILRNFTIFAGLAGCYTPYSCNSNDKPAFILSIQTINSVL
jgi:hypothetical protein